MKGKGGREDMGRRIWAIGLATLLCGFIAGWFAKSLLPSGTPRGVWAKLQSADPTQRCEAALFLAAHPDPKGTEALASLLLDKDEQVRLIAAVALARLGKPALPALLKVFRKANEEALRNPNQPFHFLPGQVLRNHREAVLFVLSHWAKSSSTAPIVAELLGDKDPQVVSVAQDALRQGGAVAMKAVMPYLNDRRRPVRVAALSVLGAYGDAAIDTLRRFVLEDDSKKVKTPDDLEIRQMAVYALGNTRSDRALPLLKEALKDPQLAPAAWQAIANLQTDAAKRFLLTKAHQYARENKTPPYQLLIALGAAQIQEAKPLLLQWLRSSEPGVQQGAILAVGMLRAKEAVPTLVSLLNSSDIGVAAAAANALGILNDPQAVPALCQALKRAKETQRLQVVLNALHALQSIGSRQALPSLEALLKVPDLPPMVREKAKQVADYLQSFGR